MLLHIISGGVLAALLRGNSTDAYIFCQSLLPESFPWPWSFDTYRWISGKNYPKHIFTETLAQDSFRVFDLSSCNFLAETNKFCLNAVLLSCLVSSYRNHLHRESNPGQLFRVVAFVSAISSSTQTTLLVHRFSVVLTFRATRTAFTGTRIQDTFSGVSSHLCSLPDLKK
jgi:hypothetical protein